MGEDATLPSAGMVSRPAALLLLACQREFCGDRLTALTDILPVLP